MNFQLTWFKCDNIGWAVPEKEDITPNSEIIEYIYYCKCSNGEDNASFIFASFQKV